METIRNMVFQLDPSQGSVPKILSVQQTEFCHVLLWNIQLYNDVAIILIPSSPGVVAESGNEHWFTNTAMGVPSLPDFSLRIKL